MKLLGPCVELLTPRTKAARAAGAEQEREAGRRPTRMMWKISTASKSRLCQGLTDIASVCMQTDKLSVCTPKCITPPASVA